MTARNADCKPSSLYSSAYVDGAKNSSAISSANGYRYAMLVVTAVCSALDVLAIEVRDSTDTAYDHVVQVARIDSGAGVFSKTFLVDKNFARKNLRVKITGTGDNTLGANTRPAATISCFEFDSKVRGGVQADYELP